MISSSAPILLTMGEPAGIGGDLTLKAWLSRRDLKFPAFAVLDDPERLHALAAHLGWTVPIREIGEPEEATGIFDKALPVLPYKLPHAVRPGRPDAANAPTVIAAIGDAARFALAGRATAVVTNPVHKKTLYDGGFHHGGHTEYLAEIAGPGFRSVMMLACPGLRVVPVTVHYPLAEALRLLRTDDIVTVARITADALVTDFGIEHPRLALAALNPHGGESGALGHEEQTIIEPAATQLRDLGIAVRGPDPADTLFHEAARRSYDAVICMYHDQAQIPLKTLDFYGGVNITLGLPFVRTSPDHGTAFDIAGTGRPDPGSLIAALRTAAEIAACRRTHGIGKRQALG